MQELFEQTQVETLDVTDAKCHACGASIPFDPETGALKCAYCGHAIAIPEPDEAGGEAVREMSFEDAEAKGNCDWGAKTKTVICEACAAESVYDALQVADVCPYCGSNHVMEAAEKDTLAPGVVCPFKVSEAQAGERFGGWIRGRLFTPRKAKQSARADAFRGVYLPYWTFDAKTISRYTARYGIDRVRTDKDGKRHIETRWYPTRGLYQEDIDDQLICASTRHEPALLSRIEPFETGSGKPYRPEYVAGFASERYSVGLQDGWTQARGQIEAYLRGQIGVEIRSRHRADRVDSLRISTVYDAITYKYMMLPVWLSSFKYREKVFQFMVNGQTGKVGGRAPVSPLRVGIAILLGAAVLAALVWYFSVNG